jgi:hypothetical protein
VQHVTDSTPSLQLGAATRRADQLMVTSLLGTLRIVQAPLPPAAGNGSTGCPLALLRPQRPQSSAADAVEI